MMRHIEKHRTHRIGWLRAAILDANDGIVSTVNLVLGMAAAGASSKDILRAGFGVLFRRNGVKLLRHIISTPDDRAAV